MRKCIINVTIIAPVVTPYVHIYKCSIIIYPHKRNASTCTVRLLTHVLCKPTHFFLQLFIYTSKSEPANNVLAAFTGWVIDGITL